MTDSRVGLGSNTSTTQPLPTADVQGTPQGKGAPADGEAELVVVPDAVNELLARAGVDRAGGIHDRVDARATDAARSAAATLGGKEALPPAAPRAVVMGDREIQGAEALATYIDRVFNSFLPSAVTDDGKPVMREGNNLVDLAAYFLGANANGAEKRVVSAADSRGANGGGYQGDGKFFGPNGPIIRDKMTPQQLFSKEHVQGLFAAATQRSQALGATGAGGTTDAQLRQVAELTADQLLAAFLKCNINDPNNNPENQNMLHQVATDCRQLQIDAAQKKAQEAEKQLQEAQKYAETAKVISTVVIIILIIITIIISIFTFGAGAAGGAAAIGAAAGAGGGGAAAAGTAAAGAAAAGGAGASVAAGTAATGAAAAGGGAAATGAAAGTAAAGAGAGLGTSIVTAGATAGASLGAGASSFSVFMAGFMAGSQVALGQASGFIIASVIVGLVLQSVKIGAETKAAHKQLDADDKQNEVKKHQAIAEMFQAQIDDQAAIIKIIMESKNQVVEAVLKMMKASQSSYQAVSAAGQSKG